MKPLRFPVSAEREVVDAAQCYDAQQPGLGARWLVALNKVVQAIQSNPHKGRQFSVRTRQCRIPAFPYAVIFQTRASDVYIVAITHLRRQPGYWLDRLEDGKS